MSNETMDFGGVGLHIGGPGPRGYSAYEVAVQNGYSGTEEEWIASLYGTIDKSLATANAAAEAKATGDAIAAEKAERESGDTALDSKISTESTNRAASDTALENRMNALQAAVGSPLKAATKAAMTDENKIYVYTGSESGMTNGNWYYYDGNDWVSGGVYNAVAINTDTTLTVSGMAADAKRVGDYAFLRHPYVIDTVQEVEALIPTKDIHDIPPRRLVQITADASALGLINSAMIGNSSWGYYFKLRCNDSTTPQASQDLIFFVNNNGLAITRYNGAVWSDWKIFDNATDTTLSIAGMAADAGAVGDLVSTIKEIDGTVNANLFDMDQLLNASGWTKESGVYTGVLSNLNAYFGPNAGRGITIFNGFKPNTQYTISLSAYLPIESERETESPITFGLMVSVKYTDSETRSVLCRWYNDQSKFSNKVATTEAGRTVEKIFLTYNKKPSNTWAIREMSVSEGSTDRLYSDFAKTGVDIPARNNALGNTLFDGSFFTVQAEDVASYCAPINAPTGTIPADYYADFISDTWDTLLSDYPDEVTKEQIILDSSGTYPIYRYIITPPYYEKTVFLSAGAHGPEFGGFFGLYRFVRLMMDNGYKYPTLRRIRHRTRFVIVPIWNPWGVQNSSRFCSLGYEPNGNFPNASSDRSLDSSGRPAYECNEAKAIQMTFASYPMDYWMDCHTDPYGHNYGGYGYTASGESTTPVLYSFTKDFHDYLRDEFNNDTVFHCATGGPSYGSGIMGYGEVVQQVPTNVVEVSEDVVPDWSTSSDFTKICLEWFGGVLSEMIGNGVLREAGA